MASSALRIAVSRKSSAKIPDHHVLDEPQSWSSYLMSWIVSDTKAKSEQDTPTDSIVSFKNPWPSYHKPTALEKYRSLIFGIDRDPCLGLAASHVPGTKLTDTSQMARIEQVRHLLSIEQPDFAFNGSKNRAKSTWLGHATMLLQLPSLVTNGRPIRVLFDPIFSMRCSPSPSFGPIRSYPPPCKIEDLPAIDIVLISHNHYDHLDSNTILALWKLHKSTIRFIVPLKNKRLFLECGIPDDRVQELDWWESVSLTSSKAESIHLKISCTPAQHNSGRVGAAPNETLWCSWYVEHKKEDQKPYRIFFAGDTGYQFHGDPAWPPQPTIQAQQVESASICADFSRHKHSADALDNQYPPCPAFEEIADRLGPPHLLYLPIALGATWAYLRSFFSDYLPDSLVPFPRHSAGITGAIHMPPWDAVHVLNIMTKELTTGEEPVAIGIHWGTFVTDQVEVLKTLGQLEWACDEQDVQFLRELDGFWGDEKKASFIALNHGQSIFT